MNNRILARWERDFAIVIPPLVCSEQVRLIDDDMQEGRWDM